MESQIDAPTNEQQNPANVKKRKCPFPQCKCAYPEDQPRSLKQHLRTIKGGGYDLNHPEGHPEWQRIDDFIKIVTRPKDVPESVKEERRAASQDLYYKKNRDRILENAKLRRERILSTLEVAKEAIHTAKEREDKMRTTVESRSSLLQHLYGKEDNYEMDKFVNLTDPPTIDTFPRIVAYMLMQNLLPDVTGAIPNLTRMFDAIPGATHYRKASALLHPDKNPQDNTIQSVLNAAYDLWRPILEDPELKDVTVPAHDVESTMAFTSRGEKFALLSQMYFCYMVAINNAVVVLSPPTMSIWGLKAQLAISEAEVKIVASTMEGDQDVESLIGNALKSGGKVGSQTGDNDTQAEMSNQRKRKATGTRKRTVERGSSSSTTIDNRSSTRSPADVPIDPELLKTKRPRRNRKP